MSAGVILSKHSGWYPWHQQGCVRECRTIAQTRSEVTAIPNQCPTSRELSQQGYESPLGEITHNDCLAMEEGRPDSLQSRKVQPADLLP